MPDDDQNDMRKSDNFMFSAYSPFKAGTPMNYNLSSYFFPTTSPNLPLNTTNPNMSSNNQMFFPSFLPMSNMESPNLKKIISNEPTTFFPSNMENEYDVSPN